MTTAPSSNSATVAQVTSEEAIDAKEVERLSDTRGPIRIGFWALIVGFGLLVAWAAWAPLDEGVTASALVSVESRRKTIQHFQGGVVHKVLVKEGTEVKSGDVLIELDDSLARATHQAIRQNYLSQRALEGRLMAEVGGAKNIVFHPDLANDKDPLAMQHMAVQQQLFAARRAAQQADMAAGEQAITGMDSQITGLRQMLASRRAQQALQTQQLAGVRSLADEGFAPRNQALQLEQAQAELRSALADLETNVARQQSGMAEARLRQVQRRGEYAKEASGELANVRREVQANQEKLVAAVQELERMQIKTPAAGQVIGLAVTSTGGVVQAGQHLMDILPSGEALRLDVRIPPQVIDRVAIGNVVEVRFSAFASSPHLVILGKLVSLSKDAVSENTAAGSTTFYLARVELTAEGLKALAGRTVQPGMTADVLVRTGERSLLTYMLNPLLKRVAAAMTEQ